MRKYTWPLKRFFLMLFLINFCSCGREYKSKNSDQEAKQFERSSSKRLNNDSNLECKLCKQTFLTFLTWHEKFYEELLILQKQMIDTSSVPSRINDLRKQEYIVFVRKSGFFSNTFINTLYNKISIADSVLIAGNIDLRKSFTFSLINTELVSQTFDKSFMTYEVRDIDLVVDSKNQQCIFKAKSILGSIVYVLSMETNVCKIDSAYFEG